MLCTKVSSDDNAITTRDIRFQNADQNKDLSSVSEVIRNNSLSSPPHDDATTTTSPTTAAATPKTTQDNKGLPQLPPLKMPEPNEHDDDDGWGESKTPGADEHMKLSPLDENAFDSPENSMSESQLRQELATRQTIESAPASATQPEDNFRILMQQKDNLMLMPPSAERDHRVLLLQKQIMLMQQQMNLKMQPNIHANTMNILQQQQQQQQQLTTNNFLPPIGTRPPRPVAPNNFQSSLQAGNDYMVKMQQLDAITRCLQTPSGLLDGEQIRQLQLHKETLQRQLHEETTKQAGTMSQQQINEPLQKPFSPPPLVDQQQQQQQQTPAEVNEHLQNLIQMRERLLMQQNAGTSQSSTNLLKEAPKQTSSSPTTQLDTHQATPLEPKNNASNQGTLEITHTSKMDLQPKSKGFVVPPYSLISTETKSSWIARELLNLEHDHLTNPKTRYFSTLTMEQKGQFSPSLERTYSTGYLLLTDIDAQVFKKEWSKNDGPVFLIVRHKLLDGTWMAGGLLHVLSRVEEYSRNNRFRYCCKANIVSSAIVNDLPWLRSDKVSREVYRDMAFRYLQLIVSRLQEGKCTSLFRFQDKIIQQVSIYAYVCWFLFCVVDQT